MLKFTKRCAIITIVLNFEICYLKYEVKIMAIIPKGKEPSSIKKRLDILFPKLNQAYPDKKISGLYKDHKKWGEIVTELYRALGYPDGTSFLEAYG